MKKDIKLKVISLSILVILFSYFIVIPGYIEADIYHPVKKRPTPPANVENIYIRTTDNVTLNAWYVKAKKIQPTIVFCHGNGGNLEYYKPVLRMLESYGFGVFIFDYRGYGNSTGYPHEQGLYTDLWSVINYLQTKKRINKDRIILWGQSLGGAVAIDIASKTKFKGVIVQGTFTSIKDMTRYRLKNSYFKASSSLEKNVINNFVNFLPILQNFNSEYKIKSVKTPILIAHAVNDKVVPAFMSRELAKSSQKSTLFISKEGCHNDYFWIEDRVLKFISTLD